MTTVFTRQSDKINTELVKEALAEVLINLECPFSGHQTWTIVDQFVTVVPWSDRIVFNNAYPAVMLVCNECGYMALFSAIKLGLVAPDTVD